MAELRKCSDCNGFGFTVHFEAPNSRTCSTCGGEGSVWACVSLEELKFGPRFYTPAQVEQIADASRNRRPLNSPALPIGGTHHDH